MTTFSNTIARLVAPDYRLMRRVNRWRPPRWVRWWMVMATRGGDGWLWVFCGIVVLASRGSDCYAALLAASLAAATGIVIFRTLKRIVARKRPCEIEPHCWSELLPPDRFSFPSGHTITAFAVAVSLGLSYPSVFAALLFCALSVGLSRIVLGLHFLSDVVVGAGHGYLAGYGAFTLLQASAKCAQDAAAAFR